MNSRLIRRVCTAVLLAVAGFSVSPARAYYVAGRDLVPVRFHADGSMDCAKWCGLLESCC